jgi:hypothetical protein
MMREIELALKWDSKLNLRVLISHLRFEMNLKLEIMLGRGSI